MAVDGKRRSYLIWKRTPEAHSEPALSSFAKYKENLVLQFGKRIHSDLPLSARRATIAPTSRRRNRRTSLGGYLVKNRIATTLALLCLYGLPALAQDFRATISGHVFDSSGAAVPNAKVQLT